LGNALAFLNNYFNVNQNAYGLKDGDLAVFLVATPSLNALRPVQRRDLGEVRRRYHTEDQLQRSENQAPAIDQSLKFERLRRALTNRGNTLDSLLKRGLHLAVCQVSAAGMPERSPRRPRGTAEGIYNELVANLGPVTMPHGAAGMSRESRAGSAAIRSRRLDKSRVPRFLHPLLALTVPDLEDVHEIQDEKLCSLASLVSSS